jgi:hypothetical protein
MTMVGDGTIFSICGSKSDNDNIKKSFEKKNCNIGRGVG